MTLTDYGKVRSPFNYVALMPQARFLDFIAGEAATLPTFTLRTGSKVTGLLEDGGRVSGVRYRDEDGEHDLPAELVIGTDGRFSKVRRLAGMRAEPLGATTDILWFRLPRRDTDPAEADVDLYFGAHHYVGLLGSPQTWQVGYSLPKGDYPEAKKRGIEPIRRFLREHVSWLADRAHLLDDFGRTTLLSVDISRVPTWHRDGLLLLGDAAHVISPVGGNGILMAIQDAVACANRIVPAWRSGSVTESDLAAIQADRAPAIRQVQADQVAVEQRLARARERGRPISPPSLLKLLAAVPGVRARNARKNAYGPHPPRLDLALLDR